MRNLLNKHEREIIRKGLVGREINVGRDGTVFHITFNYTRSMATFSFKDGQFIEKVIADSLTHKIPVRVMDSLFKEAKKTILLIDKYKIYGSTEGLKSLGIPLKIHMRGASVYLFCPDTIRVRELYKDYVRKSEFLDNGWYFKRQDE